MKKIIILAYDFPPLNSIGAQRPYSWYKYFKNYGLYPIIVTRNWNDNSSKLIHTKDKYGEIYYSPYKENIRDRIINKYGTNRYKFFRKLISFSIQVSQYFTNIIDPKYTISKTANSIINNEKIDYIIATGEPFILFKYASNLSVKYKIPWFADYRDGWTINYKIEYSSLLNKLINKYYLKYFEKKYSKKALNIFTVSEDLQIKISQLLKRNVQLVSNGFLQEYFVSKKKQNNSTFNIIYTGTIYPYQRIDIFLKGFKKFISENDKKINLSFYGSFDKTPKSITDLGLEKYVTIHSRVPQTEIVDKMKEANLLLLLAGNLKDGSAVKVYDYLAVKRKILLSINDNGTLEKIINNTNSGIICNNEIDVYESLKNCYNEWILKGYVECNTRNISAYDRNYQANLLSKYILASNN